MCNGIRKGTLAAKATKRVTKKLKSQLAVSIEYQTIDTIRKNAIPLE